MDFMRVTRWWSGLVDFPPPPALGACGYRLCGPSGGRVSRPIRQVRRYTTSSGRKLDALGWRTSPWFTLQKIAKAPRQSPNIRKGIHD